MVTVPTAGPTIGAGGEARTRLLVGLDGSRAAEEALRFVADHFSPERTDVHLLSVIEAKEGVRIARSVEASPVATFRRRYLRACAQDLRGFTVRCIIAAHGSPGAALIEYGLQRDVHLIVVTSRGPALASGANGSVVAELLARGSVPVAVLPARGRGQAPARFGP